MAGADSMSMQDKVIQRNSRRIQNSRLAAAVFADKDGQAFVKGYGCIGKSAEILQPEFVQVHMVALCCSDGFSGKGPERGLRARFLSQ